MLDSFVNMISKEFTIYFSKRIDSCKQHMHALENQNLHWSNMFHNFPFF